MTRKNPYLQPSVLIVDDQRDAVTTLSMLLEELGCEVSYTCDPRLALALARKCTPDIAFIDLRMPYLSGLQLGALLRAEKTLERCALVALSGYGGYASAEASIGAGFQAFLAKPANVQDVVIAIEGLVPRARSLLAQGERRSAYAN